MEKLFYNYNTPIIIQITLVFLLFPLLNLSNDMYTILLITTMTISGLWLLKISSKLGV